MYIKMKVLFLLQKVTRPVAPLHNRVMWTHNAVFYLRGKPLNCFGQPKKLIYENEELYLLQHAFNITEGSQGLCYNKIIIAIDADVDGMHIRLLLLTYFLKFFFQNWPIMVIYIY